MLNLEEDKMTNAVSCYRWTPALLDDFRREVGRFAEGIFDDTSSSTVFAPSVNFAETDTGYEVSVELPGLSPDDVSVEFKDGHLWVTGERKEEIEQEGKKFHRVERRYGSFRRVIAIGNKVDPDGVEATYKDGLLTVTVPKAATAQSTRIEIKT